MHFYTDNRGNKVENPRHLRKSEKALKRLQRKVSRQQKGSHKRLKAINRLGRKHLKVSRQRKDFVVKLARCVVKSNDLVVFEALKVRNMVRKRCRDGGSILLRFIYLDLKLDVIPPIPAPVGSPDLGNAHQEIIVWLKALVMLRGDNSLTG